MANTTSNDYSNDTPQPKWVKHNCLQKTPQRPNYGSAFKNFVKKSNGRNEIFEKKFSGCRWNRIDELVFVVGLLFEMKVLIGLLPSKSMLVHLEKT